MGGEWKENGSSRKGSLHDEQKARRNFVTEKIYRDELLELLLLMLQKRAGLV